MNSGVAQLCRDIGSAWQTMPCDLELKVDAERIVGPVHGYHLGCYSVATEDGFHGYAKVYVNPPSSPWSVRHALAKYSAGPFPSSEMAVQAVIHKCELKLADRDTRANRAYRFLLKLL